MNDPVNSPDHYRGATWECIEIIDAYNLDYYRGNALKYIARHKAKGGAEDIAKAMWYLRHAVRRTDLMIAMAYNMPNDHDLADQMTHDAVATNFDIENGLLIAAIDAILESAVAAVSRQEVEAHLTGALSNLRSWLTQHGIATDE